MPAMIAGRPGWVQSRLPGGLRKTPGRLTPGWVVQKTFCGELGVMIRHHYFFVVKASGGQAHGKLLLHRRRNLHAYCLLCSRYLVSIAHTLVSKTNKLRKGGLERQEKKKKKEKKNTCCRADPSLPIVVVSRLGDLREAVVERGYKRAVASPKQSGNPTKHRHLLYDTQQYSSSVIQQ